MLRQLDLCSGVGVGFPLSGLQLGGFELIGLAEIDQYCSDILSKRFPQVPNYGDMRHLAFNPPELGQVEIITSSPPCQPYSLQGKRRGAADERDLFFELLQIIQNYQPKFAVIENVPGLLNCPFVPGAEQRYFTFIMGSLAKYGYDAEWVRIGSGHCGAPFVRERLLVVAVSSSLKLDWERTTPWTEQVRRFLKAEGISKKRRGVKSRYPLQMDGNPPELAQPIGVKSGDGITRKQRAAAGNALDPRVAAFALRRVLYLHQKAYSIGLVGKVCEK